MRTWKKMYRVTWNERMTEGQLLEAVCDAFPELDRNVIQWNKTTESRKLYITDPEGERHRVTTVTWLSKYEVQRIMDAFETHNLENPLSLEIENEGQTTPRLHDAVDWWPGLDTEAGESVSLDGRSLYMTSVRHLDEGVDPLTDGVFDAPNEQIGALFRALRHQAVLAVNNDEWDNALFDTGCEMVAVEEEHLLCPSDW